MTTAQIIDRNTETIKFIVEHISKKKKKIKVFIDKSIVVANIFRIQAYDSVMCGYGIFVLDLLILYLKTKV